MNRVKAIHVVMATWCPHCVPTTTEPMMAAAKELEVPFLTYDIDTPAVAKADQLVKEHGDWKEDYLIPQVFFEFEDGNFIHVLTGDPQGVQYTRQKIKTYLGSSTYKALKDRQLAEKRAAPMHDRRTLNVL